MFKAIKKKITECVLEQVEPIKDQVSECQSELSRLHEMMESLQQSILHLEENVRNDNVRLKDMEAIEENLRNNNDNITRLFSLQEAVKLNSERLQDIVAIEENLRSNNERLSDVNAIEENLRNVNQQLAGIDKIVENLNNNNSQIAKMESNLDMLGIKVARVERRAVPIEGTKNPVAVDKEPDIMSQPNSNMYEGIDYFDFENYFRGPRSEIKKNQEIYVEYFVGKENVLDIGCGRGEFLELLQENHINATGIDIYEEFVDLCKEKGLNVICGDALKQISEFEKVGGIFAGQLVEHLSIEQIKYLCDLAYDKLEEGACIIMETPNPTSLAIYTHAFYMDPSHQKPVHPLTLKYLLEKAGFREIDIVYTESSRLPFSIPKIQLENEQNTIAFNEAMSIVQETLFGSQDYAIIARR